MAAFKSMLSYVPMDGAQEGSWDPLKQLLDAEADRVRVFYLATSPDLYGAVCRNIGAAGLNTASTRVVLEKPIGRDLRSARAINDAVGEVFAESQTFRIDHYLGKETVQNLMALRFANTIFERLWNADVIDHVQITVAETVGVEGRGAYYDHSGALRDMLQNHLLQLLCLLAMESPVSMDAQSVRDEKLKVLRALRPMQPHEVAHSTVRGQYVAGAVNGQPVAGYLQDLDGSGDGAESRTETFVALKAEVHNRRWANVPFYLRTGKRLPQKVSEVVVQFRSLPFTIFPPEAGELQSNLLIVRLQPEEGMRLEMMTKEPGPGGLRLRPTGLDISFEEAFGTRYPEQLRAPAHGHRARQRHPVHAPRRGGSGLGLGGADAGFLGSARRRPQTLHLRRMGADGRHRAHRTRWPDLARAARIPPMSSTSTTRRSFLAAAAAGSALLARPARAAGTVVVGTFGGDYSALLISEVERPLLVPKGIEPTQVIGQPAERKTRLLAERGSRRGSMDVVHLSDTDMFQMAQLGILEPVPDDAVPNARNVIEALRKSYAVPHIYSAQVLLYNPDKVPVPPKSYADLWDPKYRGRVAIADGNSTSILFAAALAGGGSMTDWEPAKAKMMALRSLDCRVYPSNEALAAGWKGEEVWLAPMWLARGFMWKKAGLPMAHVVPSEGATPVAFEAAVPKNARDKDNAWAYLNAMLDPRAQLGFADRMGYVPTVTDAVLPPDLLAQIGFSPENQAGFKTYDYEYVSKNAQAMLDFWNKEFKG